MVCVFPLDDCGVCVCVYSYSMAHCRDCQGRLVAGEVRVSANVFSSSARHAGYSINYWCLKCMCARPVVRRLSRLFPLEVDRILPGLSLLREEDLLAACGYLGIDVPDPAALAQFASNRVRSTRSGRKFNTWGGDDGDVAAAGAQEEVPEGSRRNKRSRQK